MSVRVLRSSGCYHFAPKVNIVKSVIISLTITQARNRTVQLKKFSITMRRRTTNCGAHSEPCNERWIRWYCEAVMNELAFSL